VLCWIFEALHVVGGDQTLNLFPEFRSVLVGHDPVTDFALCPILVLVFLENGILPYGAWHILEGVNVRVRNQARNHKDSNQLELVKKVYHETVNNIKLRKLLGEDAWFAYSIIFRIGCKEKQKKKDPGQLGMKKTKTTTTTEPVPAVTFWENFLASLLVFLSAVKAVRFL